MSTTQNSGDRFREIRRILGLTQQQLAERLMLSRNYITLIETGVKEPSIRVVSAAERLLTGVDPVHSPESTHLKTGVKKSLSVAEGAGKYETVALRTPFIQRTPSTRRDCELYVQQLLDKAERSENPNAWPVIHDRLQKKFPLVEWEQGSGI